MFDPSRLQIGIEIQIRARHFRRIGRDPIVPCLPQLLPQPQVDRLARQCGRGGLQSLGLGLKMAVRLFRQWQVKVPQVFAPAPSMPWLLA